MSLRIVLVGTKHSGNVGSVARAMKNFGLNELWLVAPRCRIDDQAFALASHAGDILERARVVDEAPLALHGCSVAVATTARVRASPGFRIVPPSAALSGLPDEGAAVLFGPEDTGLSNSELDLCQFAIRIPTAEYASLNLAQAVVVIAYEWLLTRTGEARSSADGPVAGVAGSSRDLAASTAGEDGGGEHEPATRDRIEPMIGQLMETLLYIGYTEGPKAGSVEHLFRRMFDKAGLTKREVAALRGLWAQTKWAADQPPERIPGRRQAR